MKHEIIALDIADFNKCSNIWNMEKQSALAEQFYHELLSNNRITFIYTIDGEFIGEISLVFDMKDSDYTITDQRIYISDRKTRIPPSGNWKTIIAFCH